MKRLLITILLACLAAAAQDPETVPLFFIANQGQAPSEVQFMAQGSGVEAYFLSTEVLFRVAGQTVRMQALGSNPAALVEGVDPLPAKANFLIGSPDSWQVGVPLYGAVAYRGMYPGIDMNYGGDGRNFKSQFLVAPGADPSVIRIRYVGAGPLRLDDSGALIVALGDRELREEAPVMYQLVDGGRVTVNGQFAVSPDQTISFVIGPYDASLPLVIDPTLTYSTLFGGSSSDAANALAVDSTGAVYLAGFTASRDISTSNPEQNFNAGGNDVFVAKLNPAGNGLVYCTYLGGSADDRAFGIAVDASGNAYVTGSTTSTNFPTRSPIQSRLAGPKNAFLAKLNAAGNTLLFSTYLGGSGSDIANAIALDSSGNAYLTGDTTSINFPATALQKFYRGSQDAFVAKIAADGSRLVYSTFLGGSYNDHGAAIAVDTSGTAYLTGSTFSADFPLAGAWQPAIKGGQDAFVARLSADGNSLLFSTFLGGNGGQLGYPEMGQGIALDAQGNAYVTGSTASSDFPLLHPLQVSLLGSLDAFAAKFNSSGVLQYSTYLGGSGIDVGNGIAVDSAGTAYVVGYTMSRDLPVTGGALQGSPGGDYDAFVAAVAATGDSYLYLSYLGGNGSDTASAVRTGPGGSVYVAGWTLSTNFPVAQAFQSTNAGNYGAFLTRMAFTPPPVNVGVAPNSGSGLSQTFTFQFSDSSGAAALRTVSALFQSSASTVSACSVTYTLAGNTLALLTDSGAAPSGTITPGNGSQQNSQCILNGAGSSVSLAGNVLTLNLAITFQAAFAGSKNIYMQSADSSSSTGWQQAGSWTVPASSQLSVVSVTPGSGSGSSQTFSFLISDPKGYATVVSTMVLINNPQSAANGCYIYYAQNGNSLYLTNNAGTTWQGPITMGQGTTLQNSQCSISASGSSASGSGINLTVNIAVSFQAAFAGSRNIYVDAYDGITDTGWVQKGSWTVTAPSATLTIVSVSPSAGSGSSQTFTFQYSDSKGYAAISSSMILINNPQTSANGCFIYFSRPGNGLYLTNDAGTVWQGPITMGQTATLQNSQCSINAAGSSQSGSGNNLTVNIAISFFAAFAGNKNVYIEAYDGVLDTQWLQKSSWTVTTGSLPLSILSVTPNTGSGSSQTFSFQYSDSKGYAAIVSSMILINTPQTAANGCYIYFSRAGNNLYLTNDAGTVWQGPIAIGQSGSLQNSQCSISGAGSSQSGSGNNLTLNVAVTFLTAFRSSTRNIYVEVYDGSSDTGWLQFGSWNIP